MEQNRYFEEKNHLFLYTLMVHLARIFEGNKAINNVLTSRCNFKTKPECLAKHDNVVDEQEIGEVQNQIYSVINLITSLTPRCECCSKISTQHIEHAKVI